MTPGVVPDLSRYLLAFDDARRARMSTVVLDPFGALQAEIEEVSQREDLDPSVRLQKLRAWEEDLTDLLGTIGKYTGDLQLVQEAVGPAYHSQVMGLREDADIRRVVIERGLTTDEEMDAAGVLSHADIDRLTEERLLDYWVAEVTLLEAGGVLNQAWQEMKHPRGAHGKFSDVLGRKIAPKGRHGKTVPIRTPRDPEAAAAAAERARATAGGAKDEKPKAPPTPAPHLPGSVDHSVTQSAEKVASDLDEARNDPVLNGSKAPARSKTADELLGDHPDTQQRHSVMVRGRGSARVYSDERAALHDRIIDTLLRERMAVHVVGQDGQPRFEEDGETPIIELAPNPEGAPLAAPKGKLKAVFLAGGTASGKSTALKLPENKNAIPMGSVHIDPDEIKTMLPEFNALVAAKDEGAAGVVHEESSDLAARLLAEAQDKGLHVVIDGTGNSDEPTKFAGKISKMLDAGYETHAMYVNAPTDIAVARAVARGQKSGRFVAEPMVRSTHANVSRNFDAVRQLAETGKLKSLRLFDTGGSEAKLVLEGGGSEAPITVHDGTLYNRFLAKADER